MFRFDSIVESYLGEGKKFHRPIQQPTTPLASTSSNSKFQASTVKHFSSKTFLKDIKSMDISNQRQAKEFLRDWENGSISPEFEFKFSSPNGHLLVSASNAILGSVPEKLPLFAVTVRERTPALRFMCTKFNSNLIWLRAYLGKDVYDANLTAYRSSSKKGI